MIQIYKSISETNSSLKQLDSIENGCWINIVAPSEEELILISKKTGVPLNFLRAPLDDEETSRIDVEDGFTLVVVDIPFTEMEDNSLTYDTYPLAIIHSEKEIITVCLKNSRILTDFINGRIKSFFSFKKSRFILQILNRISTYYLIYLRQIDKKSVMIEKRLHKSMKNRELIQLHSLEKSLVYFSTSLKANEDYTTNKADDGKYTIEFTKNTIGTSNTNAGKKVEVQYKAIVTSEEGYTNTANTSRNETEMGKTEVKGYTGTITLTKYAEDGKTILKGAEFKLYKATKDKVKEENSGVSALRFIKLGDGIYKLALADNEATSTDTLVAVNGTLTVKGLDEGTYWFEETKAPEGYSINVDGASATIKESKDKNVTVPTSLKDTKLSALPSTGGIGTTIFTIAGCLIMVTAAGLFFASRKRTNK